MFTVFFGTDTVTVRKKAYEFIDKLRRGDVLLQTLTSDGLSEDVLQDTLQGVSLFGTTRVIVFESLLDEEISAEIVRTYADALVHAETKFVGIEGALKKSDVTHFTKMGADLREYALTATPSFNVFSLADALVRRDKKSLWILYLRALREGRTIEEIIGTLLWQLKTIRLVTTAKTAQEAGLKDFVFSKAKQGVERYSVLEMTALFRSLLSIYHESHRGALAGDLALEKLILSL